MTGKVKESLFGVLAPFLNRETLFLDLFAGTGSLSFEALSRGARLAFAVESHPQAVRIIQKNKELILKAAAGGGGPATGRASSGKASADAGAKHGGGKLVCRKQDVFAFLKTSRDGPFHIAVADPPFALKAGEALLESFAKSRLYDRGTVFVVETGPKETLKDSCLCFEKFALKNFRDKKIWFYEARLNK